MPVPQPVQTQKGTKRQLKMQQKETSFFLLFSDLTSLFLPPGKTSLWCWDTGFLYTGLRVNVFVCWKLKESWSILRKKVVGQKSTSYSSGCSSHMTSHSTSFSEEEVGILELKDNTLHESDDTSHTKIKRPVHKKPKVSEKVSQLPNRLEMNQHMTEQTRSLKYTKKNSEKIGLSGKRSKKMPEPTDFKKDSKSAVGASKKEMVVRIN